MQAAQQIATLSGDAVTAAKANAAFNTGVAATANLLWNSSIGYFRGYTGGDAIMADCLYGLMLSQHFGFGWSVPMANVSQHLAAELKYNGNEGGFYLLSGRSNPGPVSEKSSKSRFVRYNNLGEPFSTIDDVNWMGASATWSYLQLALGTNIQDALEPSRLSSEIFRTYLKDNWNLVGIITSGDWDLPYYPYVTSHYGFMLPNYYLLPGLTGQQVDIPGGKLSFAPKIPCPFDAPLLLAGTTGHVQCNNNVFNVSISFGSLSLPAGGLSINNIPYPQPVNLVAGGYVTWS
jgi:hypothetical protein